MPDGADLSDRMMLNLPVDAATVASARVDTIRRLELNGNIAMFVLTDQEAVLYDQQRRANDAIFGLMFSGEWKRLGIGYAYVTLDLRSPRLVVRLIPQASPKAVSTLEAVVVSYLTSRAPTEIGPAVVTADELSLIEDNVLQSAVRADIEARLKVQVAAIEIDHLDQKITVRLERSPAAESIVKDAAAIDFVSAAIRSVATAGVPVALSLGSRSALADSLSNPGPRESGERADSNGGQCTLGYATSETIGSLAVARVSTAGHCGSLSSQISHGSFQHGPVAELVNNNAGRDYELISTRGDASSIVLTNGFTQDRVFSLASATTLSRMSGVEQTVRQTSAWGATTPNLGSTICLYGASFRRDPGATFTARNPTTAASPTRDRSCGTQASNTVDGYGAVTGLGNYACRGDSGGLVAANNGATVYGGLHSIPVDGSGVPTLSDGTIVCASTMYFGYSQRTVTSGAGTSRSILLSANPIVPPTFGSIRNAYLAPGGIQECMSAEASGTSNGTKYLQWGCIPNTNAQTFGFQPAGSPYTSDVYRIVRPNGVSPICLSVDRSVSGGFGNAVPVQGWGCLPNLDDAQLWQLEWNPSGSSAQGWVRIRSLWSPGQCISVNLASGPIQGAKLHMWDCFENNPAQRWILGPNS